MRPQNHAPHGFVPGKPGFRRSRKCAQIIKNLRNGTLPGKFEHYLTTLAKNGKMRV
jgi:hypothetical protein